MISNYVMPMILKEKDAYFLPDNVLYELSKCSTDIIIQHVTKYINENESSSDNIRREVAKKFKIAYKKVKERAQYLQSDEIKRIASELSTLTYSDINASVPLDKLKGWKYAIEEILNNENATPYTMAINKDVFNQCTEKIKSYAESASSEEEARVILNLYDTLLKNKRLFKNAPFKKSSPTVLSSVMYKKDIFLIMYNGISFLIDKLESGKSPITWRYL